MFLGRTNYKSGLKSGGVVHPTRKVFFMEKLATHLNKKDNYIAQRIR